MEPAAARRMLAAAAENAVRLFLAGDRDQGAL
jgi:hypothetical protein